MNARRLAKPLLGSLCLILGACSHGAAPTTAPPTAVGTAMPAERTFHREIPAFGELAADRRKALALSLPQPGEIAAIHVVDGERVPRGAPLLELVTDPATRSAYLQARSAVTLARSDVAHTQALRANRLATDAQVDAARKTLADAEAALAAQGRLGGAEPRTTLRAPTAGTVTALAVQRGQRIAAGAPLVSLSPGGDRTAQLGVDPAAAAALRDGMAVQLRPVYGPKGSAPLRATVAMVGNAIDPQSHLVHVVATLAAPTALATGTAVAATIEGAGFTAWAVPRDALQSDAHGDYVLQVEHGKAVRIGVRVLAPNGSPIGVAGAIDAHAPVVTLGSYEIAAGDAVCAAAAVTVGARGATEVPACPR